MIVAHHAGENILPTLLAGGAGAGSVLLVILRSRLAVCGRGLRGRLESDRARLAPLVLATMASQALLVVLAPTIVAVAADFGVSVATVGQARTIAAAVAIAASITIVARIDAVALPRLLALGGVLAIVGSLAVATAPTLPLFLLAHIVVGLAFACLLSAGFAGVAAFAADRRRWAIGYVAGANALAWIVVAPVIGFVADRFSWRAAQAVPAGIALVAALAAPAAVSPLNSAAVPRLRTLFSHRSAQRWIGAELLAYAAWAALLTFVGAFFMQRLGVREAVVGWLLAGGAAAYVGAATRRAAITKAIPRRQLVAAAALLMAVLSIIQFNATGSAALAVATFCLIGLAAGIRTPTSSELGIEQLPDHPGAMMAARTAATQVGYLLGALVGGAVIAAFGYGGLGFMLAASIGASAWLILRVDDPLERATQRMPWAATRAKAPGTSN